MTKRKATLTPDPIQNPPRDPWAGRIQGLHCETCIWYVRKAAAGDNIEVGRCRRHAPTMAGYPVVFPSDWCGDHRLDETKAGKP